MSHWIHSRWTAFLAAMGTGATIWAASPRLTGEREPWDAGGLYYVGALVLTGLAIGLLAPIRPPADRRASLPLPPVDLGYLLVLYSGVLAGQFGYVLSFIPRGPLLVVGLGFLAVFSGLSVLAATITCIVRHNIPN